MRAEPERPELAEPHTGPAAGAEVGVGGGDVLRAEHHLHVVNHRSLHGQTIRAVAVANPADEGGLERPHGVAAALFLVLAEMLQRHLRRHHLVLVHVRPGEKAAVQLTHNLAELLRRPAHADAVAEAGFLAEPCVPAHAGRAHDAICELEDLGHVLYRQHLPEVLLLHLLRNRALDLVLHEGWRRVQLLKLPRVAREVLRPFRKELLDELAPLNVREQIRAVILRVQVPLLAFAVLMAELTHDTNSLSSARPLSPPRPHPAQPDQAVYFGTGS